MRSRGAFDTVLKWGLGCVTCMIYMCKKAVLFVCFFKASSVSCPQPVAGHILY